MDISVDSELGYTSEYEQDKTDKINEKSNTIEKCNGLYNLSESSVDTYTPKSDRHDCGYMPMEVIDWEPVFFDDKLIITGIIDKTMHVDIVCKVRVSSLIFINEHGVSCGLVGPMSHSEDVPDIIRNQFKYVYKLDKNGDKIYKDGIPETWEKICLIWKLYRDSPDKSNFDWTFQFNSLNLTPLPQAKNGHPNGKIPKTKKIHQKLFRKYEKYKKMLEKEIIHEAFCSEMESDRENINTNMNIKKMKTNGVSKLKLMNKQRTACYVNTVLTEEKSCQTNFTAVNSKVLSPARCTIGAINGRLEPETNDDSSSVDFYENIVANSTQIQPVRPQSVASQVNETCRNINLICSQALEKFNKKSDESPVVEETNEDASSLEDIDIDLFSQTVVPSNNNIVNNHIENNINNNIDNIENNINNNIDNNNDKNEEVRAPTPEINTSPKGIKRKSEEIEELDKSDNLNNLEKSPTIRCSLRKRKKLNYREILFNRVRVVSDDSLIISAEIRKSISPQLSPKSQQKLKKSRRKYKNDPKLQTKCYVLLMRENLQKLDQKTPQVVENPPPESVKELPQKPQQPLQTPQQPLQTPQQPLQPPQPTKQPEIVFKTPLDTAVLKKKRKNGLKFNRTFHLPTAMPKVNRKLSLPANPMEMWQIIQCRKKPQEPQQQQFSILSDTSSESNDKKRRKLFSPDNWMQSDGCLKTLSQNRYESSDESRFSIRFNTSCIDSEFSDSSSLK